ncbi:MAG: His-Xaa-Ser system protein HxsD, partial [Candidatus Nealsonbacteria bacterium CG_4_9_14_0_8_um_filter_35_12]
MKLNKIINHSINLENNEIIFSLNTKIYPQEIIYKTCYTFIDRMYVYLDSLKKNEIIVSLKSKEKLTKKQPESLKDEFLNELLNILIREAVSKKNQKFLE